MPTQKLNAAAARLADAITSGDTAIYRIRQQQPSTQPNAYRQALKAARDPASKAIRGAREVPSTTLARHSR